MDTVFNTKFGKKIAFLSLIWIAFCLFSSPVNAQVRQYSNTTSGAISFAATPCTAALVRTFTVSTNFTVQDVNIGVVAAHGFRGDMVMALTSPAGTQIIFNNATGGSAQNYNVLADDEATTPIASHTANDTATNSASAPPYQRTFRPSNPLTGFDGQLAQGTWQLLICDAVSANNGTFYRADLYITQASRIAGVAPSLSCPVGQTLHDWDVQNWPAGSANNSYPVTNIGPTNFAITTTGTWVNNATYGGQSPTRTNTVTGGLSPPEFSLFQFIDFASQSDIATTIITLPVAVPQAQFRLFDIDFFNGQFADKISVTGRYYGANVIPTLTNGVTNSVSGNTAIGDGISADRSGEGNIVVTFTAPVDTIIIEYGNHTTAPTNPGVQAMAIHDFILCNPQAIIAMTKTSSVISDPVNLAANPKAIPGAVIRYCLLVSNTGSAASTGVQIVDDVPAALVYQSGSIRSGVTCAGANVIEDDDAIGADENDPVGANFMTSRLNGSANTLAPGVSIAVVFDMLVP